MGQIRVGIGGWTFEPWRGGVFYPDRLPHARELEFASRAVTSIEINGTYYSTFKPTSWRRWRDETPDDFVFAVKASRYATNRKNLGDAGASIEKFLGQGLTELGPKLGPINWQLAATKKFVEAEIEAFLGLLPKHRDGVRLRHAIEVRHQSFVSPAFYAIAKRYEVAIVTATGDEFPEIDQRTADFVYARSMSSDDAEAVGIGSADLKSITSRVRRWAKERDVYVYFIAGAKERNPAAAQALLRTLASARMR